MAKNLIFHRDSIWGPAAYYNCNLLKISKLNRRAAKCAAVKIRPLTLKKPVANCAQFPSFALVSIPYVNLVTPRDIAALRPDVNDGRNCRAEYARSTVADA